MRNKLLNEKIDFNKGITLIALVITIIILLILVAVSIATLTGENGILSKAMNAKVSSEEAEAKEKVMMMLSEWQIENAINKVKLEDYLLSEERQKQEIEDITKEDEDSYIATVKVGENSYDVEIKVDPDNEKVELGEVYASNKKFLIVLTNLTNDYMFQGETGNVEIKIEVLNLNEDEIQSIQPPEGASLKEGTSNIYIIPANETTYRFSVTTKKGLNKTKSIKIKNVLEAPKIRILDIKGTSLKIQVDNQYPDNVITEYKYYIENELKYEGTTEKSHEVRRLIPQKEYKNIKVVAYIGTTTKESNIETVTMPQIPSQDVDLKNANYTGDVGSLEKTNEGIVISAPGGWNVKSVNIQDLPLNAYNEMQITYSFEAGYDYSIALYDTAGNRHYLESSEELGIRGTNIPRTTKIFDISGDYSRLELASSSMNAKLYIYEIKLYE